MKTASSSVSQHTDIFQRNLEEMISRESRSLVLYFILTQSALSITVAPLAIDTNHNLCDPGVDMINAK
ncbi:dynamin-2 [Aspergillus luchuensis]|uniref:Dynamin-2 n=1 Tax=Aspergillus kawachii TaxID=1069201 RepID=A0A146FED6_ASPKA|nr:dynamin-2 [Aspergillus luchuensis]